MAVGFDKFNAATMSRAGVLVSFSFLCFATISNARASLLNGCSFYRRNQFGNEPQLIQQANRSKTLSARLRVLVIPERHSNQPRP
jgi:hypothetical protein